MRSWPGERSTNALGYSATSLSTTLGRADQCLLVGVDLAAFGLLHKRRRRLEPFAVALGQLSGARNETGEPGGGGVGAGGRIAVDVLKHPAGPAGEADTHDRSDVGVGDRFDDALVQTL